MQIKHSLCKALVLLLCVTAFAGCNTSSGGAGASTAGGQASAASAEGEAPAAAEGVTGLTYWTWEGGTEPLYEVFHQRYPNLEIVETKLGSAGDYTTKIQQTVASGSQLPDILLGEANQRGLLFELDIWEVLTEAPYNANPADYFDSAVELCTNGQGELVGIEQSLSPSAMAYKKSLAREYFGTDDRAELEAMFPDFSSLIAAAPGVQEQSGGETYLFSSSGLVVEWLYNAAPISNVSETGAVQYTAKMQPLFQQICALRDAGGIDTFTNWTPQANAAYAGENHIFYPCPNWAIVYQIKSNDSEGEGNWGLMIPPGGGYSHGGTCMGISKTSTKKEEAWAYIDWYTNTDEGVEAVKETANYYVPTKKYYDDSTYVSSVDPYFGNQDVGQILYGEIVPTIQASPISQYDSAVSDVNSLLAQSIMADPGITAADAVANGVEELQNKLPNDTVE